MGYTTRFEGALKFSPELTAGQLNIVRSICGEDAREHPEWGKVDLYYIDVKLLDDFSGIEWDDETEKAYNMVGQVDLITREVRKLVSDFCFTGQFVAQGEEYDDRWILKIAENGFAVRVDFPKPGQEVKCPHCDGKFRIDESLVVVK